MQISHLIINVERPAHMQICGGQIISTWTKIFQGDVQWEWCGGGIMV